MNTQKVQTSAKAAHYPHIAWNPDLENQHGDPDHPNNLIKFSLYHYRDGYWKDQDILYEYESEKKFSTG